MSRKSSTNEVIDVTMNEVAIAGASSTLNELTVLTQEHDTLVRATALALGYALPGDAVAPDLIQRDIGVNMRRSVEACLEVGRGLAVLKVACGYGEFGMRLDALGIEPRVAQKFTQSAMKFSNAPSTAHLTKAIGSQTKLFEMLVLDDEQIEELALTGQTGELSLDDVATMSVKELRAKLREAKQTGEAKDRLLADKNAHIDAMAAAKKFKPRADSIAKTEAEEDAMRELAEAVAGCEVTFARLRNVAQALAVHDGAHVRERAAAGVRYMVAYVKNTVLESELPDLLDVAVDDEALLGRPAWMKDGLHSALADAS